MKRLTITTDYFNNRQNSLGADGWVLGFRTAAQYLLASIQIIKKESIYTKKKVGMRRLLKVEGAPQDTQLHPGRKKKIFKLRPLFFSPEKTLRLDSMGIDIQIYI